MNTTLKTYDISFWGRKKGEKGFAAPHVEQVEAPEEGIAVLMLNKDYEAVRVVSVSEWKGNELEK